MFSRDVAQGNAQVAVFATADNCDVSCDGEASPLAVCPEHDHNYTHRGCLSRTSPPIRNAVCTACKLPGARSTKRAQSGTDLGSRNRSPLRIHDLREKCAVRRRNYAIDLQRFGQAESVERSMLRLWA